MATTTIGPNKSWRLVHNGKDVLAFMETAGFTTTVHTVFEAESEQECLDEISRLQLNPIEENKDLFQQG